MRIQLLPTTFNENGCATVQQHSCCFVIDDCVAIDAGNLAMATSGVQRSKIRDIILTHAHLDHIAGLPLFIDDLFAVLEKPISIHATTEVIEALKQHIFNWVIYPDFSQLQNQQGEVMVYEPIEPETEKKIAHLKVQAVEVNHKVPSVGIIFSDEKSTIAISGDTSKMDRFWEVVNRQNKLSALLIECAFPNELDDLAHTSHHLTPKILRKELTKFHRRNCPIYIINMKPMYCEQIVYELSKLDIENLQIIEVGKVYEF
jgi:cAMP phosphodiesterase